ncbi:hypothetical protein G6F46_006321 [Rhizopus delemar]|nr:hypothetical protein G6F55_007456 [Rhizopus delemar]KAG1540033.1 hypothetical protein G6F51_008772 [Rhizopus arrhizus]KAG1494251.1 hypothetical protein G6F54_008006 [Rhizopus delemar]KAG1508361.1 hypothetical protein G6F53_008251 [Rhizopus delemar]KAG1518319.1 hypothetical protein G6F52_009049 [Rhizopus delemar]
MSYRNDTYPKDTIRISSKFELDREMKRIKRVLLKKKMTDENWDDFNKAIENINTWCMEDRVYEYQGFIDYIKELKEIIIASLTSERTILSATAVDLLITLAKCLSTKFDPINEMILPTIRHLFGRSNKVHVSRTVSGYKQIIHYAHLPRTIPKFCSVLSASHQRQDPARIYLAECLEILIRVNASEKVIRYQKEIESAIKVIAVDATPDVRRQARACFEIYRQLFPEQTEAFVIGLSKDIKKYLAINDQSKPVTSLVTKATPSSQQQSTRQSMQLMPPPSLPTIKKYQPVANYKDRVLKLFEENKGKDLSNIITFRNGKPYFRRPLLLKKKNNIQLKGRIRK